MDAKGMKPLKVSEPKQYQAWKPFGGWCEQCGNGGVLLAEHQVLVGAPYAFRCTCAYGRACQSRFPRWNNQAGFYLKRWRD